MSKIFISYRRVDSEGWVRSIDERLVAEFGRENVFRDTASISAGTDFVEVLHERLAECRVMLVVIGPMWTVVRSNNETVRLLDEGDLVRQEIELAIKLGVWLIPVLVSNAPMPPEEKLPEPIQALARRQAHELLPRHFDADMNELVSVIRALLARRDAAPSATPDAASDDARTKAAPAGEADVPGTLRDRLALHGEPPARPSPVDVALRSTLSSLEAPAAGSSGLSPLVLEIRVAAPNIFEFCYGLRPGPGGMLDDRRGPVQQRVGSSLRQELMRSLKQDIGDTAEIGELLHQAFFPRALRELLCDAQAVLLVLDDECDRIPWEFAKAKGDTLPLGLRVPVMRVGAIEQCAREVEVGATDPSLVIVGAMDAPFFPLPGAREEAEHIAVLLGSLGIDVRRLDEPRLLQAAAAVSLQAWRSVHLTGHGVSRWSPAKPDGDDTTATELTGLVLDPRAVLSVDELLSSDRPAALVTLGALELDSWALPLLEGGSAGVCVPGQPTDDTKTAAFFVALYSALCAGDPLSRAAWKARLQTAIGGDRNSSGGLFVPLAMRSYGAAGFRLVPPTAP